MDFVPINHIIIVKGKPTIAGTRLRVMDIAAMVESGGATVEWILDNYDLHPAQVYAALAYYYDHQAEIDEQRRDEDQRVHERAIDSDVHIARIRARTTATDE